MNNSTYDMVEHQASQTPDDFAFVASDHTPLTYAGLADHIDYIVAFLNSIGIGRNDCVATVIPNGPEMATAFIAIASGATVAPLNPAYSMNEFKP